MALDATQVAVAGTGGLYRAPLGQAKPADSSVPLDAAYLNLGYFTSDGVGVGFEDSVQNHFAWQGAALVRATRTETLTRLTFTPIQTRGSVLETFHSGSQVTDLGGGDYELEIVPAVQQRYTWIFDAIDGTNHYRWWIPNGEITERGELMHVNNEPIGYPMTMTFYPDSNNRIAHVLSDDAAFGDDI